MAEPWPFDQAESTAAITTVRVLEGHPILVVQHFSDDHSWAFLCGTTNDTKDGRVIGMGEALQIDPSLRQIADLPTGWRAWRETAKSEWSTEQENLAGRSPHRVARIAD